MSGRPLQRVSVRGYASLRDVTLDITTPVTVLIGPNGSGKSNVVRALELLGEIVDRRLQTHVAERGGFNRLLHQGPPGTPPMEAIHLTVMGEPDESNIRNGYTAELTAGQDDEALLRETMIMQDVVHYPDRPYDKSLGVTRESRLTSQEGSNKAFASYVLNVLGSCRVYHFDDVSHDAPPKRSSTIGDDTELRRDAANIAAYLYRLQRDDERTYSRIVAAVRAVAPFFDDFVLEPHGAEQNAIILRWRQTSSEAVMSASQLSDGTLRFVCLATLLLSPHRPQTIALDEPELGLHPFAIHQLAELLQAAAAGDRRVIAATQSVPLLDEFPIESVVIAQRENGATTLTRPDVENLRAFIDDYSLGDLWRMNLLGGRPTPERTGGAR